MQNHTAIPQHYTEADLQSAYVSGETIQLYDVVTGAWLDLACLPLKVAPARLRVKPDAEPKLSKPAAINPNEPYAELKKAHGKTIHMRDYVFFAVGETGGEQPADAPKPDHIATLAKACANDDPLLRQVGGSHYRDCAIQPVEFIEANRMGFLEGCVVKRLARHDKPTGKGRQDIEKAIHELQILLAKRYPASAEN